MVASLRAPARKNSLGPPPKPEEVRGNLSGMENVGEVKPLKKDLPVRQLNVRVTPDQHTEIKIEAIHRRMSLGEYLLSLHNEAMERKREG